MIIGAQTVFSSFFLSMLAVPRRDRADGAGPERAVTGSDRVPRGRRQSRVRAAALAGRRGPARRRWCWPSSPSASSARPRTRAASASCRSSTRSSGGSARTAAALTAWMIAQRRLLGWAVASVCALVGLGGLIVAGRRAAPVLPGRRGGRPGAAGGRCCLQEDRTSLGAGALRRGVACAFVLGLGWPIPRLDGCPRLPLPRRRRETPAPAGGSPGLFWRPPWASECGLVFALTVVALLSRTWALTEISRLPRSRDGYLVDAEPHLRTASRRYLDFGFMQNNGGAVQILPQYLVFHLFGTSIFTLRLAAVLWSDRRRAADVLAGAAHAGSGPAVVSAIALPLRPGAALLGAQRERLLRPDCRARAGDGHRRPVDGGALLALRRDRWPPC